jgi:hypothetical protein
VIGIGSRSQRAELIEELETGNTTGSDVLPETQAEIDRLQSGLMVRLRCRHARHERSRIAGPQAFIVRNGCSTVSRLWRMDHSEVLPIDGRRRVASLSG